MPKICRASLTLSKGHSRILAPKLQLSSAIEFNSCCIQRLMNPAIVRAAGGFIQQPNPVVFYSRVQNSGEEHDLGIAQIAKKISQG